MEEYKIPKEALENLKDPEVIRRQMEEGKTFQEIIGYTTEAMEKFYRIARKLFEQQEYRRSADAFIFMTTLNPMVHSYWLGLGMSEHLDGDYQGALLAYAMAILTNVENPIPHYHSASCYQALGDDESAMGSLEIVIRCAEGKEEHIGLKEQAVKIKEALKRKGRQ
ncbi:MAG: SycD/LcrH family type III secretion system chaperone [Waddliaceae bacterium]